MTSSRIITPRSTGKQEKSKYPAVQSIMRINRPCTKNKYDRSISRSESYRYIALDYSPLCQKKIKLTTDPPEPMVKTRALVISDL